MKLIKRLSLLFTILFVVSCSSSTLKIGFVENYKLYSRFDLTNEFDQELQSYSVTRSKSLDSLKQVFEAQTAALEKMDEIPTETYQKYNDMRNSILYRQKSVDKDIQERTQEYEQQIWDRLNLLVKKYALENEFDFVLGANGTGNLMYAKEAKNLTEELILFCNDKYNGKLKANDE